MVVVVRQVRRGVTAPKLKLLLKPKLRRGRGSSSFNRRVREEQARIEKANTQLRKLGLPIDKFAGESSVRLNQRILQENARRQSEIQRQARQTALKQLQTRKAARLKVQQLKKRADIKRRGSKVIRTITSSALKSLKRFEEKKGIAKEKREKKFLETVRKQQEEIRKQKEKPLTFGEKLLFERALATDPRGTGLKVLPEFSKGEKFSLRTANVYAGVQFDKALRRSKKYKNFSNKIDKAVNSNKFAKFAKDNILAPISEDALLFAATGPFMKTTTSLKNEFLLDEIKKLNRDTTRQLSVGLKKARGGGVDEILLISKKSSKNFDINTVTKYKVKTIKGKVVIVSEGKGVTGLVNANTGKVVGKPVEFSFFGKGKGVKGRIIDVGTKGEKVISGLGKLKTATGQVKIITKDLKVIKSRFGSLFTNHKDLELSLSGNVPKFSGVKIKDIKIQGVGKSKLSKSLRLLLSRTKKKLRLLGTKKSVKLDFNDLAVIRKLDPGAYTQIIRIEGARVGDSGRSITVSLQQTQVGKALGQRVAKEVEKLLSGKIVKGISRSNSIDRILKGTAALSGKTTKTKKTGVGLGRVVTTKPKVKTPKLKTTVPVKQITTTITGSAIATTQRAATKTKTKTKTETKKKTKPDTKTKQRQEQQKKQKVRQRLRLKLTTAEKLRIRALTRLGIKLKAAKKILLIKKKKKKKGKKGEVLKEGKQSFDVFAKPVKGKKLIKINKKPLSETDAKDLRNYIIDTSLSRQGSIKPAKGKPNKPKIKVPKGFAKKTSFKFRRFRTVKKKKKALPKGRVIERKTRLLDTKQERNKISLRKRLKQLRPKKKKVKKPVVKRKVTKKPNQPPKNNAARRRQMLANLEKARRVKALQKSSRARTRSSTRTTTRRRIISII